MKDVCVIGAGASGLVAAKHALELNLNVTVYEQTDKVGGIWIYTDETNCHTSMYFNLKTNLTKETMMFENFPYPEHLPSFLTSQNILDYLVKYAEGLPIKFNHEVIQVSREAEKWKVFI
ncbi:hypothetical protein WR25_09207 [Diploscapter pachys]|uniref:Flavin-containing monooxygenase n=1 Tax=Diploscapter pachys TaxID=2018661 RepID=A0A2A2LYL9_9BILA|nr:hypothetical protein WR25_09207 [Diploscapter pachys]